MFKTTAIDTLKQDKKCQACWYMILSTMSGSTTPSVQNTTAVSTYENRNYGIQIQYPSDWTIQEMNASGTLINIATFVSPTGPNSSPPNFSNNLGNIATVLKTCITYNYRCSVRSFEYNLTFCISGLSNGTNSAVL